jgi:hypothetical protein
MFSTLSTASLNEKAYKELQFINIYIHTFEESLQIVFTLGQNQKHKKYSLANGRPQSFPNFYHRYI